MPMITKKMIAGMDNAMQHLEPAGGDGDWRQRHRVALESSGVQNSTSCIITLRYVLVLLS